MKIIGLFKRDGIHVIQNHDSNPTSSDVATILRHLIGHMVLRQLSRALAERLEVPYEKVDEALKDILKEWEEGSTI